MNKRNRLALLLLPAFSWAQQTVAPATDEAVSMVRGENKGNYNIVQSWELGYRYATIGGDLGKYRSDVNYRDGVRLLSSYLTVNSRDGHGHWFDEIALSTQGLGNDPYESATLRVQKNRIYRYDMLWRTNDYFNPGLTVANGEHLMDTTHRWQDHDLTLFPQSWFRVRTGYSRVSQFGPALTTEQEFDSRGDVFPIFRDVKREYNEYRVGGDVLLKGFRLSIMRRWELFKEDTTDDTIGVLQGNAAGAIPVEPSTLSSFGRAEPNHGYTSGWLGNLHGDMKWIALNARFTYSGGRRNFILNENATGVSRFGASQNRQVIVAGNADRPTTTGDFSVTLFPQSKLNVINTTSISNLRIVGNNFYEQFDNATLSADTVSFQFLGIRLITNSTDARYRFSKKFDLFGGYRYSDRLIRSTESLAISGALPGQAVAEQSNHLKAGVAGVNWLPWKALRVHLEGEIGRNDNPLTPVSERKYHALRARVQYRTKTASLGGGYQESYNNNSIAITAYSSHARSYTAEGSWTAKAWLSLDASYSKLHLDTVGGVAFFAGAPLPAEITGQQSIYISNIHAANVGARLPLTRRANIYVAYNVTKDTGDGRSRLLQQAGPVSQVFYNVQTFPLTYQTPLVRLSVKITEKLRYNLGYQYYGYHEDFGVLSVNQNYRAHTGYTSLLWSF
jgi:hypothetical protein